MQKNAKSAGDRPTMVTGSGLFNRGTSRPEPSNCNFAMTFGSRLKRHLLNGLIDCWLASWPLQFPTCRFQYLSPQKLLRSASTLHTVELITFLSGFLRVCIRASRFTTSAYCLPYLNHLTCWSLRRNLRSELKPAASDFCRNCRKCYQQLWKLTRDCVHKVEKNHSKIRVNYTSRLQGRLREN